MSSKPRRVTVDELFNRVMSIMGKERFFQCVRRTTQRQRMVKPGDETTARASWNDELHAECVTNLDTITSRNHQTLQVAPPISMTTGTIDESWSAKQESLEHASQGATTRSLDLDPDQAMHYCQATVLSIPPTTLPALLVDESQP